jgi:glycine cleavage system P protein (glycine dehydrogenase) subunit 2
MSKKTKREKKFLREDFHAARWEEPTICELGAPGMRGVIPPELEKEIAAEVGDIAKIVPAGILRKEAPRLPQVGQPQVLRHFTRLSQMTMGTDTNIDLGGGTCTMKYSPKVNEALASMPEMLDIHPLQDDATVQGILEIIHKFGRMACEISGLDAFSCQPAAGAQGIFTNSSVIRAYHESRGEAGERDEIITTIFSHPADSATPRVSGYKVIVLYPDENGYPDLEALKAAVSGRTAGILITNPEDTGIYNPRIREYTDAVHAVGGLCSYDQANLNGIMGIARAREAGFDMCHYNLHKTFSTPHGSMGPGCGAVMCRDFLKQFLPRPLVEFDGSRYYLDYDMPMSIGKIREFLGNVQVVLRSYAWVMNLGPEGIRKVAETAVINNNYQVRQFDRVRGLSHPYAEGKYRLDQVRYSWEGIKKETGVGTEDLEHRIVDYGVNSYFTAHEPWLVPEPYTAEPCESYSKQDLDEYFEIIQRISDEAHEDPEMVKHAPYKSSTPKISRHFEVGDVITTWRLWQKRGMK